MPDLEKEMKVLSEYLIRQDPGELLISLYQKAHGHLSIHLTAKEERIWRKCMNNRFILACTDAALAIKNPSSGIRKKIFLALSLLESSAAFHRYFLPQKRSIFFLLNIGVNGMMAVAKTIIGYILLPFL
jgi:hypothetical protein